MADLIKKIKIKKQDGTFTDYIPIGADAVNVETSDGESVELKLNKKPYYYNTVADMKADTKLKAGDMAVTLGYYEENDGGAGQYRIVNNSQLIDDGGNVHNLINGLKATLISCVVNVKHFGAKGDGETNDIEFIQKAIDNNPNKTIFFPDGIYIISNSIYTPSANNLSVKLLLSKYAIVKASSNFQSDADYLICLGGKNKTPYTRYANGSSYGIEGGIVDCNNKVNGIEYSHGVGGFIKNIEIRNANIGINIPYGTNNGSNDLNIENIDIYGDDSSTSIAILVDGSDNHISNIRTFKTRTGIKITRGGNHFLKVHCLLSTDNYTNYNDSIGFDIDSGNNIFDFCYSDQFSTAFYVKNSKRNVFRSAWAYYYRGGNYNHIAFKFSGNFSAIIDDLYVNFPSAEGTNKVLDITTFGGSGKLRNLHINNQTYMSNNNDDCFSPYYNKDFLRIDSSKLNNLVGNITQINLSANNNVINLAFTIKGLTLTANNNQTICTLPEGYYNKNQSVNLIAEAASTATGYKYNCWIRNTGELILVCNQNVGEASSIFITGSYYI